MHIAVRVSLRVTLLLAALVSRASLVQAQDTTRTRSTDSTHTTPAVSKVVILKFTVLVGALLNMLKP